LFDSFWQGGFEGADHINGHGAALDMNSLTLHNRFCDADYARLETFGIRTIRESVGWRLADRGETFDFTHIEQRVAAAQRHNLQIIWTLFHYGWPAGLDILSERFVTRFAEFCAACAEFFLARAPADGPVRFYTPINEISFLSFAAAESDLIHGRDERLRDRGYDIKKNLVRAALAGCDAIRRVDPQARFLHTDPLIHIEPEHDAPELVEETRRVHDYQYQALDMLAGRMEPQLGGGEHYLDIIGVNYYHSGQWEHPSRRTLLWHLGDPRRRPLHDLLRESHTRYRRPLLIAETSHVGSGRGRWIVEVGAEIGRAQQQGTPVAGVCLYPIIDRPDWQNLDHWHHSGLWDVEPSAGADLQRRLCVDYATQLFAAQNHLSQQQNPSLGAVALSQPLKDSTMPILVVFSHLRWDFVFQRPQQLMVRLAQHYRVFFIEEPIHAEGLPHSRHYHPFPNVCVIQPHTPVRAPGFHDDQIAYLQPLLTDFFAETDLADCVVWLYTPMALPLVPLFPARVTIYDCMDELRNFKNAPAQLTQRENALLEVADVVFTGGPSLYESRRDAHPNVFCFPSSVDAEHFAQAHELPRDSAAAQSDIPHPRLGFFGVIDERMDQQLLAELADAHPEWHIVLVGPVVKIDPAALPQRANLHYLGQHPYSDLPAFAAGWDVCLLPFARNDATRFISPTKTLEYMAAGKPVVAVDLPDIVNLYGDAIFTAGDGAQFIAACEAALALDADEHAELQEAMRQQVLATSWDRTVADMLPLMRPLGGALAGVGEGLLHTPSAGGGRRADCLILGAGPTGLSAALQLGEKAVLLERGAEVGGNCRSIEDGGFTFDHAGHIMFSNDDYVHELYRTLLGDNVHWQDREAWIYSKGVFTRYPFQSSLYGLPTSVLTECLVGAIEARFGSITDKNAPGSAPLRALSEPRNFHEFIYSSWGRGVADHFAIPYNQKLWTVPLTDIETSWMKGRVPLPNLEEMISGALQPLPKPVGPNAKFGYPLRGGFQALMSAFLPHLRGDVHLNSEVSALRPSRREVITADGRHFRYRALISTLPLPELIRLAGDEAPESVRAAARQLQFVSVRCVNLGIGRAGLTDKHWIYYPEDTLFHRIFCQGNASPHCNREGGFGLTCEITYSAHKPLPASGDELIRQCIDDCIRVGMIAADDPVWVAHEADIPYAYVIYDHRRAANVQRIKDWLNAQNIIAAGRYAEWEYYNSDHAFIAGKRAAQTVAAMLNGGERRGSVRA